MTTQRFVRLLLAGVLTLLALAPAGSTQAAAREVWRSNFRGETAVAYFYDYDGCIETYMEVYATENRVGTTGQPDASSSVGGYVNQYDYCNGTGTGGWFYADLEPDAFQIDRQLNTASLNTTVEACYDECFPVELNLTWTATGDPYREKGVSHSSAPDYRSVYRYDATTRYAEASGSVTTPLATTSLQTNNAYLQSVKAGSITIWRVE